MWPEVRWLVEEGLVRRSHPPSLRPVAAYVQQVQQVSGQVWTGIPDTRLLVQGPEGPCLSAEVRQRLLHWHPPAGGTSRLGPRDVLRIERQIRRHLLHQEPVQYVLQNVSFLGLLLRTRKPTLIPRWETEEWVGRLAEEIREMLATQPLGRPLRIVDACTGSGCIALGLVHLLQRQHGIPVHLVAIDVCPRAIRLARVNARLNDLQGAVEWREADLLAAHDGAMTALLHRADMIVSNPPYLSCAEYEALDPSVREYEDVRALLAGGGKGRPGVQPGEEQNPFYRHLLQLLPPRRRDLPPQLPRLVVEVGESNAPALPDLLQEVMSGRGATTVDAPGRLVVHPDSAGTERVAYVY